MSKRRIAKSPPRCVGACIAWCMDDACAKSLTGGDLDSEANGGDHHDFLRRVRAHVIETGHEVCVTESREYVLEPASPCGPRTVAEIEAVTAEIVARIAAERQADEPSP